MARDGVDMIFMNRCCVCGRQDQNHFRICFAVARILGFVKRVEVLQRFD